MDPPVRHCGKQKAPANPPRPPADRASPIHDQVTLWYQLRMPTPRLSSHSASAVSTTTKPSISA
ncbi:hypothetical protein D3C87_617890 [compost metagenome]